jgi:hypothetical protein
VTRREILINELCLGKYDVMYQLLSKATDKYCKGTCPDNWDYEKDLCIEELEKKCIRAWLESEPENGNFFTK